MRNAGFIAIVGVFLVASAQAATIVTLEPSQNAVSVSQPTLYEDIDAFTSPVEPNGPKGTVPRAHATEPGTLVLLGTGLLGVATLLRRRSS